MVLFSDLVNKKIPEIMKSGSNIGKGDETAKKAEWRTQSAPFQCKPDLSCWNFLPQTLFQKWNKMKSWFWEDFSKTHLLWIKLIFFFQSGSLVVLYPYLVIHMRSLGLSVEEVALVNGVIPVADIIGPPMAGFLADKIGNFRMFMSLMTLVSGGASLLLLLVPSKYEPGTLQVTCCPSGLCQAANVSFTLLSPPNNLTLPTCWPAGILEAESSNYEPSGCEEATEVSCLSVRANWGSVLIYYTILRSLIDVLRASSVMMFEGAVVVTIKQLGGDYGLQKLFGTFGAIIWGPISGQIIDMASTASGNENYAPVFYTFFVMRIISALLILKLNLSFKKPAKKIFKNLGKLITRPHIFMFLVIFFVCGAIWGFLEAYLFWFLEDLGSTKLTMGISLAIGTVAGIPLTIASGVIIKKFGNSNIIVLALSVYSLRLLGYSFIEQPLQSLIFEILKPFGNSLLMIAAMTYAKNNADIETMASLEGLMGALYFGVGKSVGSLVGGLLIDELGVRNTFRCFGTVSLVAASLYFLFTFLWEKRRTEEDPETGSETNTPIAQALQEKITSKDTELGRF